MENLILVVLTILLIVPSFAIDIKVGLFHDTEYSYSQQLSTYQWNSNKGDTLTTEVAYNSEYFREKTNNMN